MPFYPFDREKLRLNRCFPRVVGELIEIVESSTDLISIVKGNYDSYWYIVVGNGIVVPGMHYS